MSNQPLPFFQAIDSNGDPISGAKLNFYATGTSTPKNTYSESTLTTANANPVVADSAGRFGAIYLLSDGAYKVVYTDASDNVITTLDPVDARVATTVAATLAGAVTTTGLSSSAGVLSVDINNLTAETSFDPAADKLMGYDNSAGALRSFLGQYVQAPPLAYYSNLVAKYASASTIDIDADFVVVADSSNRTVRLDSVNLTCNLATTGANALDAGSEATSTWYYGWVIYNGTTTAGLISASATSPTLPSGYTHKALVTSFFNDSSSDIVRFVQQDRIVRTTPLVIFTATAGPATYTTQSVAAGVPPIAKAIMGYGGNTATTSMRPFVIAADANGVGEQYVNSQGGTGLLETIYGGNNFEVPLLTASTVFWKAFNTGANHRMVSTGYRV